MDALIDRLAIGEVIDRYFAGIDRCDPALIRTCFADEATYRSDAGVLDTDSGDAIGARLGRGALFTATSHIRSSQLIAVHGDRADADTMALAYLVKDTAAGAPVAIRSIRYRDVLVRQPVGWKILHRHHSSLWQCEALTSELTRI